MLSGYGGAAEKGESMSAQARSVGEGQGVWLEKSHEGEEETDMTVTEAD